MAIRTVCVGGDASRLVSIAYKFLVKEAREYWLGHNRTYSHRRPEGDSVLFMDAYSEDKEVREEARQGLMFPRIYEPENILDNYEAERVVVVQSHQEEVGAGRITRAIEGIVIFRCRGRATPLRRLQVGASWIECNGNQWDTVEHCQDTQT